MQNILQRAGEIALTASLDTSNFDLPFIFAYSYTVELDCSRYDRYEGDENAETRAKCPMQLRERFEVQEVLLAKRTSHLGQGIGVEGPVGVDSIKGSSTRSAGEGYTQVSRTSAQRARP